MRYSGLRRWEVIRVMKHHIQPDGRLLVKNGKGGKDRYTILPPQVSKDLKKFVDFLPLDNPYIFQVRHQYPLIFFPPSLVNARRNGFFSFPLEW